MTRLRRSQPAKPGIVRRRSGRGFRYLLPDGQAVADVETRRRIDALVIPPAWTDVWISPYPNGHIQALGTDQAGRRQYLYHADWQSRRHEEKFARMLRFASKLPAARSIVAEQLDTTGMSRERVLAAAFRMLDLGHFRIGGEAYAADNGSYGLSTLLREHVRREGAQLVFSYTAKSGLDHEERIADPDLLEVVSGLRRRRSGPDTLLAYREGGSWRRLTGADVNGFVKDVTGLDVSAKDFRTWHGTDIAAVALAEELRRHDADRPWTDAARRRAVTNAVRETSERLGNTPAVARSAYVDPRVIDLFARDITVAPAVRRVRRSLDVSADEIAAIAATPTVERAVLKLLR